MILRLILLPKVFRKLQVPLIGPSMLRIVPLLLHNAQSLPLPLPQKPQRNRIASPNRGFGNNKQARSL